MILDRDEATLVGRTRRIQLNATASEPNLHGFQNVRQYKTDSKGRWRDFLVTSVQGPERKFPVNKWAFLPAGWESGPSGGGEVLNLCQAMPSAVIKLGD